MVITRAPAAAASARSPAGAAAPPSRIAPEPGQQVPAARLVQQAADLGRDQGHVPGERQRRRAAASSRSQDHRRDAGQQRPQEHLQAGDVARRQAGQPGLAGPGADPGQAGPRRMGAAPPRSARRPWARRWTRRWRSPPRYPGPARGSHPRSAVGCRPGFPGWRGGAPGAGPQPARRAAWDRRAGCAGPVPSRAALSSVHQPVRPLGRGEQHCVQRAGGHRRKVIRADQG